MCAIKVFTTFMILPLVQLEISAYDYYVHNRNPKFSECAKYQNCAARRGPPVCLKWCLVHFTDGFCELGTKYECCLYREKYGFCPPYTFCPRPSVFWHLNQAQECLNDFDCPIEQKCCPDSCFVQKICKPYFPVASYPKSTTAKPSRTTPEEEILSETLKTVTSWTTQKYTTKTIDEQSTTPSTITEILLTSDLEFTTSTLPPAGSGDDEIITVPQPDPARFLAANYDLFLDDEDMIQ